MILDRKALTVKHKDYYNDVEFLTSDGRVAFEVRVLNGHTLEIRSVECIKDNDKIYSEGLIIRPQNYTSLIIEKRFMRTDNDHQT